MPIDTEQLDVDLEAVRALPDWQDEGKRRGLIRSLSANSYAAQDPDQHQAFTSKLWEAADPRTTLQKAGEFIGSATEEVVKSIPAVPAAAALAITDATGQTDTGSGFRLQRGVMDLAEQGFQRAKQFAVGEGAVGATLNPIMGAARLAGLPVPASAQAERDQTLTALKQDIDTGAVPDSVARWLAGDDVGDDPDVQQWQDGLSRGLGEAALKAQGMGTVQPEALNAWLKSDRNPLRGGINDDNTDFSTRDMLADYLATRDPQSWNAFTNRVAETDGQYQTRIGRAVREGTQLQQMGQEGLMGELLGRGADMQGSPIDLGSAALPLLRGMKLLKAVKGGAGGLRGIAAGMGEEFAQEASTEYLGDARSSDMQVLEAGAMGAVGSGVLEGGFATAGRVLRNRPSAEMAPMQTGNAQIDQVNAVLRASGPSAELPMGNEGASDEDFDAFEQTRAPASQRPATTPASPFASVNERNVPADATGLIVGEAQDVAGSTPAAGTTQAPASQRPATTEAVPSIDNIGTKFVPPQVRTVPVIPDNPLGYRDSLDFLNEMPIAISRSGTGGELDWQETANIPKYYRPFIANEQGLPIDVVAEAAYEANLIPQPTADALMKRVQEDIGARRTYRVQGREQKAELLTREKQTVSFDKSQTKLGNKPTAMQVPFEALATGDQLTIDGEQVTVRAVESDEGGYLTKVVLEDGKKFGVQEFNPQSREGVFVDAFDPKPRLSGDPEVFSPAQAGGASPGGLTEGDEVMDYHRSDKNGSSYLHIKDAKRRWFSVRVADHSQRTSDPYNSLDLYKKSRNATHGITQEFPIEISILVDEPLSERKTKALALAALSEIDDQTRTSADEDGDDFNFDARVKHHEKWLDWANEQVARNPIAAGMVGVRDYLRDSPAKLVAARALIQKSQSTPRRERAMLGREPSKTGKGIAPPSPAAVNDNLNPAALESPARGLGRGLGDMGVKPMARQSDNSASLGGLTEAEGLTAQIEDLYKADEWTVLRSGEYNHDSEDFEPDRTVKTSAARKLIDQAQVLIQSKDPRFVRLWYQLWKLGERSSWLKDYKDHLLNLTLERAKSEGWNYGYRLDPNGPPNFKLIAYIDTPYGQVSFHLRTGNAGFVVRNPAVRSVDIRQFPGVVELIAKENEIIAAHPRIYSGSALRFWHSNRETAYKLRDQEKAVYESKRKEWKAEATAVAERINDQYGTGLSANSISSAQYSLGKDPSATVLVDAPDPVYQGKWSGDKGGSERALAALFNNEAAKVSPGGFQKQELSKASTFGGTWPSEGTTPTLSVNPNLNPAALESPARGLGRRLGDMLGQPAPGAPASQRPATTSAAPPTMSQALFDRARAVTSQQALPPVELEELFTRARNLLANDGSMELRPSDRTVIPQALAKLAAGENPQLIVNQWKEHRNQVLMGQTTASTPFAEYGQAPDTPRARLLSAYAQLDRTGQGYVRIPDLVRASGLPIADVREVLIDLSDRNQAYLTPADEPRNIPAGDRSLLVVGPSGPSLYVTLPDPAALASPSSPSTRTIYRRNTALNKAELARLGLPTDTGKSVQGQKPVKAAMTLIAKDTRLPATVRRMAKLLQDADLSGLFFQVVADGRKQYTGLYQPLRGGQGELVVNLRHLGRGNVDPALNMAETLVHEVLHHATYRALRGPKNDVQKSAIGNLEQLRRRVKAVLGSQQIADFGYQTKNIDEFIAALFTQKPFQDALAAIPAEATPKTLVQQVRTLLDEAFRLLAEIVTGKKVPPGSVLDASFQNALRLVEDGMRVAGNYQALPGGGMLSRTPSLHAVVPTPLPSVRAYHGTPHKYKPETKYRTPEGKEMWIVDGEEQAPAGSVVIDRAPLGRQRLDKIGTGEGAQAYGYGLYNAESKAVGEGYRDTLANKDARWQRAGKKLEGVGEWAADIASSNRFDLAATLQEIAQLNKSESIKQQLAEQVRGWGDELPIRSQGNLYTVELLPDESDFLDWDKPLSEQSDKVQAALAAIIDSAAKSFPTLRGNKQASGAGIYQAYASHRGGNAQAASQKLAELGIPGIKYLDQDSRTKGAWIIRFKNGKSVDPHPDEADARRVLANGQKLLPKMYDGATVEFDPEGLQTRNYVIFDENLVRILEENGQPTSTPPLASPAQPTGQVPSQAVPLKPEFGGAFPGHTPYQAKERQAWAAQEIATLSAEQLAQRVEAGQYGPVDKPFVLAAGMQRAERQVRAATTQAGQIVAQTEVNRLRKLLNPQNSLAGQTLVAQRDALGEMRDRVPGLAVDEAVEKAQVQTIDAAIPVQPTVTGLADLTTQASTEATETVAGALGVDEMDTETDSTPQEQAAGEAVQSDLEAEVLRLKQMQTAERNQFSRLTTKLQKILATLQAFAGNKGAVIAGVKARLAARRAARANTVAANKLQSLSSPAQGITAPTLPDTALDDGLEVLLTQGIQIDDWKAAMTKRLGPKYASQLTDLYERAVDLYQAELTAAHAEVEKRVKEKKAKQKPTTRPQPQRKPLAQSFPDLAKMLRKLGPAISGFNWRQIMTSTATAQRQWELDTYAQIRQHPRLSALSPEQAKQLTRELSKAWQRERRKVWKRELDKTLIAAGMAKPKHRAKIEASAPRLLSLINLGALNAATFRDAVAKEFGLKSMTDADVLRVKALAEDLQNTPEGVPYRRKAQAFIEGLEDLTKIPAVQLLESYWTAAVLSGWRTQMDIFLGFANAIENTAGSVITALRTGQRQVIADTIFRTFARFPSAMAEGYQVLKTGKRGLTASYDQDIKGNLENGYITMGASARALIAKGALGKLPGYPMLMLARLMSASSHVTTSMAYEGAKAMALARNADLYQRALNISAKDRENARQQARQVLTGGAMPANSEERDAEKAYARELLDQQFSTKEFLAQANEIAMEAALEGEVQQYSLGNMIVGLARFINDTPQRAIDALEKDGAPRKQDKVLLAALRFAAPLAQVVTGTKFIRTAGHAANRSLSYLPGLGLVRVVEKGMDGAKMDILMAQQMIGLSIGLAIYMLLPGPDDEEPQWGIEGGWKNLTSQQKSQLFSQGKQPLSLWWRDGEGKLRTVNYMNWGVNNILGMVGTMQDQRRYFGKTDPMGIAWNGILTGLWQWQDRVSLQQLQILTGSDTAFGSKDVTTTFAERLNKYGATTVGGLFPRLAKDVDAMADPTLRRTDEWWQLWAREVPMVRQLTSGARIDILGNEIKIDRGPLSRITQAVLATPEYRLVGALNARDVWLPDPSSSKPTIKLMDGTRRTLTPLESDRYQRKAGQLAKDYILANGPQLLTLEPEKAQDAIRKNAENWRKQALNWAVRR